MGNRGEGGERRMRGHQTLDGPLLHPKPTNVNSYFEGRGSLLRCCSQKSRSFRRVHRGSVGFIV